ncbi:Ribosomal protein L28/L24 [Penicillium soppii]|uniref:Ribosomal protein L28/L24 n=1 Tax=Penicillium soppii TaxID=69789 RepID=UPI0025494FD5|nr:Ribosomal protein L28/L24 [Penicillium soppii]KAJ5871771.1 Ribosomal protein L28/L24 [Penicillium soppii]
MAGLHTKSAMGAPFSLAAAFRSLSIAAPKRSFSTTPAIQSIPKLPPQAPVYPYGPSQWYKQQDSGLYGGATIQFGNKISKGRNEGKTRRSWKPNVRRKKIESEALGQELFIKVTRRALRSINKAKGLDNYLLSDRPTRIKELGPFGWNLRYQVMQSPKIQARFAKERKSLGVPEPPSLAEFLKAKEAEIEQKIQEIDIDAMTKPRRTKLQGQKYGSLN